jgi:hypothetical protein
MMRGKFADASSEKLTLNHTGAGIHGERVVVEGRYEQAPLVTSDALAAGAAGASGASATVGGAGAPTLVPAPKTIAALNPPASEPVAPVVASQPAGKKKKIYRDAAAECRFDGLTLTAFRWLSPTELAHPASEADGEASE